MDILYEIMGEPPYCGSFEGMEINFRADPKQVRKFLPEPVELSEVDPGGCNIRFFEGITISKNQSDLLVRNPEAGVFSECGLFMNCRVNGIEAKWSYCMWVDTTWALLVGWFMGITKQMGKIKHTFSKARLFELNEHLGEVGPGTRFTSFLEVYGERLATATIRLSREISPAELPPPYVRFVSSSSLSLKPGGKPSHKLFRLVFDKPKFGKVWAAEDVSLKFPESELEELYLLKPREVTSAYFYSIGMKLTGERELICEW